MISIRYLSVQEVIAINVAMIQRYSPGEHIGVREPELLEVHHSQSSVLGEDAYSIYMTKPQPCSNPLAKTILSTTQINGLLLPHWLYFYDITACNSRWIQRKLRILQWIWLIINLTVNRRLRSLKHTAFRFPNGKIKSTLLLGDGVHHPTVENTKSDLNRSLFWCSYGGEGSRKQTLLL